MSFFSKSVITCAVAISACVALASCSGGDEVAADIPSTANVAPDSDTKSAESKVSESPSETVKPTASDRGFAGAVDEPTVLALHKKLWEEFTSNNATKEEQRAWVKRYSNEKGYNTLLGGLEMRSQGQSRLDGAIATDAAVEKMESNKATVIDCQDVRKVRWVDFADGKTYDYWGVRREARAVYEHDGTAWFLTDVEYSPWDLSNRSKAFRCDTLEVRIPTQW